MKYRSRMDISAKMLEIAKNGAVKTRIMHGAFLSSPQLKEYLELLTDSSLLEYSEEEREYRTTEKGKYFLKIYKEIGWIISPKESKAMMH